MDRQTLTGCGTALVTPFDGGKVDYAAYERLVRRQVASGIHYLVALGSTAETPCLSDDEKVRLLESTRRHAGGRVVVAGVGTNSLHHTVANMRLLESADMYLVVVPYYNKPTQRGMYEYFKAVASETDKPIILYNVPSRTGINMTAQTTLELAEVPNIAGIKEASGNLSQIRKIVEGAPEGFSVLSGNDDQTLEVLMYGGHGVISVASNLVPEKMVQLVECGLRRDYGTAHMVFRQLIQLFDACFVESNPIPVKAGLAHMGLIKNELRLPMTTSEDSTYRLMAELLDKQNN